MKDRLVFEQLQLDNGIKIFKHPLDVPFAQIHIVLPVGHAHSTGSFPGGTAHFLEHMLCRESSSVGDDNGFDRVVYLAGGHTNAMTDVFETSFDLEAPSISFDQLFRQLFERVFVPHLTMKGVEQERRIIRNERDQKNLYYPANSAIDHYKLTRWFDGVLLGSEQALGSDEDLQSIDVQCLEQMHQGYFSPDAYVVVGGSCDFDAIVRQFSSITTGRARFKSCVNQHGWKKRTYHERRFADERLCTYHIGGLFQVPDMAMLTAYRGLGELLMVPPEGVLHNWLREEHGLYGAGGKLAPQKSGSIGMWEFSFALENRSSVDVVRSQIRPRIEAALSDDVLLDRIVHRGIHQSVFRYQTLAEVIGDALESIRLFGSVTTEEQYDQYIREMRSQHKLQQIYKRCFDPASVGEFLSIPTVPTR